LKPQRPQGEKLAEPLRVLALFGWRRRKVSYAVRHERFPSASRPERKRGLLQLLKTEIFDFPRAAEAEVTLINDRKIDPTSTHFVFKTFDLRIVVGVSFQPRRFDNNHPP